MLPTRAEIDTLVADMQSLEGSCHLLRFKHDKLYARRYSLYLQGRINKRQLLEGESNTEWYKRNANL